MNNISYQVAKLFAQWARIVFALGFAGIVIVIIICIAIYLHYR